MRPKRSPSEDHAISAIKERLIQDGQVANEILGYTDRPDAVLEIDGQRTALECRTFAPERVLRLHGIEKPEGKPFQLYLPLEPHVWVSEAITAKAPKVRDYRRICGADTVWLVLHSARGIFGQLAERYTEGLADLFHIAAWTTPHPFERIYVTGEYDLAPVCIFRPEDQTADAARYQKMSVRRIPIRRHLFSFSTATEGPNGQGQITVNFNQRIERNFLLQPLDRRFRFNYTEISKVENAFDALRFLPQIVYAEPTQ